MIYVNGRFLLQNQTGVNRFAYELCRAWSQMGISFILCCPPGKIKDCYDITNFNIVVCGVGRSHFWEQLSLPIWFIRMRGEKILINFTGLGPLLTRKKIMTIHDLAFMANPKWYTRNYRLWYRLMTPLCAATSLKILTVSRFSKTEIINRLSVDDKKISIIYNAVGQSFTTVDCKDTNIHDYCNEKFILAVSSIDPRKNFNRLLKAFAKVRDKSIRLYIIGGHDAIYSASITELCRAVSTERIRWLGRVSDATLKWYYSNALCFVYPSLYEGFGMPPLEAMSCGTPTIVSAIPALEEVCGDASLFINPNDENDIADKINTLACDSDLRKELVLKGYKRSASFSWSNSAKTLIDEIRNLIKV